MIRAGQTNHGSETQHSIVARIRNSRPDPNGTKLRVFSISLQSARSPPTWSFKRGVTGSKMPFVLSLSKDALRQAQDERSTTDFEKPIRDGTLNLVPFRPDPVGGSEVVLGIRGSEPLSEQGFADWLTSNFFFNIFNFGVVVDQPAGLR